MTVRMDVNQCTFCGSVSMDPVYGKSKGGKTYLRFSVAIKRKGNGDAGTDFFQVVLWDKSADAYKDVLIKGTTVFMTGCINIDKNQSNGKTFTNVSIKPNHFAMIANQKGVVAGVEAMPTEEADGLPY